VTRDDTVLVCGGIDVASGHDQARDRLAETRGAQGRRDGRAVHGRLHAGQGGLLDGKRATIHWENQDSFAEEFEDVT
jgi:transcriptional regulator GlxA family with amidase domain